jgi:hypothetical protein
MHTLSLSKWERLLRRIRKDKPASCQRASSDRPQSRVILKEEHVGRADNSGARGFGCWLWISRPHATSSYTVGMRLAGRHLTCPTVIHSADHLLSRVPPTYARVWIGSTEFAECGRGHSGEVGSRGNHAGAVLTLTSERADTFHRLRVTAKSAAFQRTSQRAKRPINRAMRERLGKEQVVML